MEALNKKAVATARLEFVLSLVAVGSFAFGIGDLIAGSFAVTYGSDLAKSFSFMWAGLTFAVINGSLALRAACNKPEVDVIWASKCLRTGISALLMHSVDLILAIVGLGIYGPALYWWNYYYYYRPLTYAAAMPEVARVVMLTCLVVLEILQVRFCKKFINDPVCHLTPTISTQTTQIVQPVQPVQLGQPAPMGVPAAQMQVPMQVQMQMQPGMTTYTNQAGQVFLLSPVSLSASNIGFSPAVLSNPAPSAPAVNQSYAPPPSANTQQLYQSMMPPPYDDKMQ